MARLFIKNISKHNYMDTAERFGGLVSQIVGALDETYSWEVFYPNSYSLKGYFIPPYWMSFIDTQYYKYESEL